MAEPSGVVERLQAARDALRYLLNFADEPKQIRTVMATFTLPGRVTTRDSLEALWNDLPALADALHASQGRERELSAPDEMTEDAIRGRAKKLVERNGWRPGASLGLHSVVELMVALGMDLTANPETQRCGWPTCGCDADAACNAALSTPEGATTGGWRPIETAPKDGSRVMVFPDKRFGGPGFTTAHWGSGHFGGMPGEVRHLTGWLSDGFFMGPQPTHWMPLPEPPSPLKTEGE